jgi:hypothetical protein
VSERGFRIAQLRCRVRVAVEREQASSRKCAGCQRVVEILPSWIAVDLNRHALVRSDREDGVPIRNDPGARAGHTTARMSKYMNIGISNRGEQSMGLIVILSKLRMRRGQNELELLRLFRGQIQSSVAIDVGLDAPNHSKPILIFRIEAIDHATLVDGIRHRHPTRDFQTIRMVGHSGVRVTAQEAGVDDLAERRHAVTPLGVHLQVPSIFSRAGAIEGRVAQDSQHFRPAQEMGAECPPPLDVGRSAAACYRLIDGVGHACVEHFQDHAGRGRSDARDSRQRSVRLDEVCERLFEPEHRGGRSLVAEHLLLRGLRKGEIAQKSARNGIDVRVSSRRFTRSGGYHCPLSSKAKGQHVLCKRSACSWTAEVNMAKYSKSASKTVESAMRRRKRGTLKSGSGGRVKSRKQAIAIGLSEARKKGAKVPRKSSRKRSRSGRKK